MDEGTPGQVARTARVVAVVATAAALLAALATPALGATPPRPTALDQPLRDGCQRTNLGVTFVTSPEWAYVYRNRTPRVAEGIATDSHPARDDQPGVHAWHDFVTDLAPDRPYRYLLGGDTRQRTGNFAGGGEGEAGGRLRLEWETGTLPAFAWPTDGDRLKAWGSWIWDCGHWRNSPANSPEGRLVGERTELHPLRALVVVRRASFRSARGDTQADAFVSSNGNGAHAVEECSLRLAPVSPDSYGDRFRDCARDPRNRTQPLARSYSFFVPAPPRPSTDARLLYRAVRRGGGGRERVRVRGSGIEVTAFPAGPRRYARTFLVGWSRLPRRPTRLAVTLDSLRILRTSDPNPGDEGQRSQPPDELNLYLDVNGYWKLLNRWVPGLRAARAGQTFRVGRRFAVEVPAGRPVRVFVTGRECDIPSDVVLFGFYVPVVRPCPPNPDEFQVNNDSPGTVDARFPSATRALGRHRFRSRGGDGAFEVVFTVRRASTGSASRVLAG